MPGSIETPPPVDRRGATLVMLRGGLVAAFGGRVTETVRIESAYHVEADEREREVEMPVPTVSTYDVTTGRWSEAGRMQCARWACSATLLADGRVLVAGGQVRGAGAAASAEIWNPTTGCADLIAPLTECRQGHAAVLLADGRLLVIGGVPGWSGAATRSTEIWDGGAWVTAAPLGTARTLLTATLLRDGRVVVIGGFASASRHGPRGPTKLVEVWVPGSARWVPGRPLATPRGGHRARLRDDETVAITGGLSFDERAQRLTENTTTELWGPAAKAHP